MYMYMSPLTIVLTEPTGGGEREGEREGEMEREREGGRERGRERGREGGREGGGEGGREGGENPSKPTCEIWCLYIPWTCYCFTC